MKKFEIFVNACLLFGSLTICPVHAATADNLEIGIDRSGLQGEPEAVRDTTLENIRAMGGTWFRDGTSSGSPRAVANFVDILRRVKAHLY